MPTSKCCICGSEKSEVLHTISKFKKIIWIDKCSVCGLIFQNPQPVSIDKFYSEGYYTGKNEYSYIDEREDMFLRNIENNRRVLNLSKFVGKDNFSLLDIGCSFGALVKRAISLGIDAHGIDVSSYISSHENSQIQGDVCEKIDGRYDAITMVEVIEHLKNPKDALVNCYHALNDRGIILIQTTNMDSLVRKYEGKESRYFLPGHLFYFSLNTLKRLLMKTGFDIEIVYYGHETGFIPAVIRKSIANMGRYDLPDCLILLLTIILHICSKIVIFGNPIHNGMVVIARKRSSNG